MGADQPLLVETFVEKDRHAGTPLAAANWLRVGETAGRGRFAAPGTPEPVARSGGALQAF